jgi:hypothetical protein
MKAGDQYTPEPVRSVEVAFFQANMNIQMSTAGDTNLGLFAKARLTTEKQIHYHGVIQFPLLNGELLDTQYVLTKVTPFAKPETEIPCF